MAEYSLQRLVDIGSFHILQSKLDDWLGKFRYNTADENVARCCEIVELNARIQNQMLRLLSLTASEAGPYSRATMRTRLSPWLGHCYFAPGGFLTSATALNVIEDAARADRMALESEIDCYKSSVNNLEMDLHRKKMEAADLRADLVATEGELESLKLESSTTKQFTEREMNDLKSEIRIRDNEIACLRARLGLSCSEWLERDRRRAETERELAKIRARSRSPSPRSRAQSPLFTRRSVSPVRSTSPIRATSPLRFSGTADLCPVSSGPSAQHVKEQSLLTRCQNLFSIDRQDAIDILRRYSTDKQNNEKIVFAVMREAFFAARTAFRDFRSRTRAKLAMTHTGPESLDSAVNEYIARNDDLGDISAMVSDVLRALSRDTRISLPFCASFSVIQCFIREACRVAWQMACLVRPIDAAFASENELFDDLKYRRSFDSDWPSALVSHHIWPCLMQGGRVIAKGEAVTRSSTSSQDAISRARGRSRSRSLSGGRSPSPY